MVAFPLKNSTQVRSYHGKDVQGIGHYPNDMRIMQIFTCFAKNMHVHLIYIWDGHMLTRPPPFGPWFGHPCSGPRSPPGGSLSYDQNHPRGLRVPIPSLE